MKKVCLFSILLCFMLSVMPVNAAVENPLENANIGCYSLDAQRPILGDEELIENAESVVLYERNSNTLLYAWNADVQTSPASLVKIMTGLITAQKANMTEAITVKESVLASIPEDAATVNLQPDEVITMEDLFYCMMVSSANDAAAVIADHIAGSQEQFVTQMNAYAKELGCSGTNFTNVHGLHDDQQYTTARDVAKILSAALDNEQFRTVFGTEKYTVNATNKSDVRYLVTGNYLMSIDDVEYYYDGRVTGGRTGVTNDGYRCLAVSAETDNMELICVITGAESVLAEDGYSVEVFGGYTEISAMLDAGFDGYQVAQVIFENQALTQQSVSNGECDVVLGPQKTVLALLPVDASTADLTYRYSTQDGNLQAPIQKGEEASSVEVWYKTLCVAQAELYAMNDVDVLELTAVDTEGQRSEDKQWTFLWVVLCAVILVVAMLVSLRIFNTLRHKAAGKRSRRLKRNRRRSR